MPIGNRNHPLRPGGLDTETLPAMRRVSSMERQFYV